MFKSKMKEAIICFKAGRVTAPFPLGPEPNPPQEGYRGKIAVDVEKCIGCGGCANVCPPRLIKITDTDQTRILEYFLSRCTYCGRCAEVCPEEAIFLMKDNTLTGLSRGEMIYSMEKLLALGGTHTGIQKWKQKLEEAKAQEDFKPS